MRLSAEDRTQLEGLIRRGQRSARVINRARILLKTDAGWSASQVAAALDTSQRTVFGAKRWYAAEGLVFVLHDHLQANRYRKLDDRGEAHLIALACSDAPEGHDHRTRWLLANKWWRLDSAWRRRQRWAMDPATMAGRLEPHMPYYSSDQPGVLVVFDDYLADAASLQPAERADSGELALNETAEGAVCSIQLVEVTDLDDASSLHHVDAVGVADG